MGRTTRLRRFVWLMAFDPSIEGLPHPQETPSWCRGFHPWRIVAARLLAQSFCAAVEPQGRRIDELPREARIQDAHRACAPGRFFDAREYQAVSAQLSCIHSLLMQGLKRVEDD